MKLLVAKTGAEMFDPLHAYGLAALVSRSFAVPVMVEDQGSWYSVSCPISGVPSLPDSLSTNVLPLPAPETIVASFQNIHAPHPAVAGLDGLLAALFTTPGVRVVSVADLRSKCSLDATMLGSALSKVRQAVARWERYVQRRAGNVVAWIQLVLATYDATRPGIPVYTKLTRQRDFKVLMTLDPALGMSVRRPTSDGVAEKSGVTTLGTPDAPLLALIGATSFLRAQRVNANFVNFYVPVARSVLIDSLTYRPLLQYAETASTQAITEQWLSHWNETTERMGDWSGLAFQVMETQGVMQSLSCDRGLLDMDWLHEIERRGMKRVVQRWARMLSTSREETDIDQDVLVDFLVRRDGQAGTVK